MMTIKDFLDRRSDKGGGNPENNRVSRGTCESHLYDVGLQLSRSLVVVDATTDIKVDNVRVPLATFEIALRLLAFL
uniref:Uncharacterized protein n=1 Tax=Cannabis sativa TaxID=3483 RepID=A0A803PTX6_CANSA